MNKKNDEFICANYLIWTKEQNTVVWMHDQ